MPSITVHYAGAEPRTYAVRGDVFVLGRVEDCDVVIDDIAVGRRHFGIHRADGAYVVMHYGTANGTYLNGTRVDRAPLADGDEIQVGRTRIVFHAT